MADKTKAELEMQLGEARKEIAYYKRLSKEGGDKRLKEAEDLSGLIAKLKEAEKALQKARDELEKRVEERTTELSKANLILKQEIFERKRAGEGLRESEQRFRSLAETTSDWVWEVDQNGFYTYSSPKVRELLGYEPAEVIGKKPFDFMPQDERERVSKLFMNIVESHKPFSQLENVSLHKDGQRIMLETSGVPILDERGNYSGYRGIDRDITERKQTEEERLILSKLESTGILAGGIAHDFNNLLIVILGNLELAGRHMLPREKIASHLEAAKKATLMARDLTQELITFAKGGAPVRELISLSSLIRESVLFTLRGSSVRCDISIAEDLWLVEADAGQMGQVIRNMSLNAREAMPGGGTVLVRAENVILSLQGGPSSPRGDYIRVSIKDQGDGIPEENLSKIFDPYFSTKQRGNQKGMGLGLTVCHSVIKNHGGYIQVESKVGVGTTFHIYLPASREEVQREKALEGESFPEKGRVLVMDDEEMVRDAVGEVLWSLGYKVVFAGDGQGAIELYIRAQELGEPFDVVILDLTVRGRMGGNEAIKQLLEIDPNIKAVVSSGYSNDPILLKFEQYGFKGALTKPYGIEKLSQTLSKIMGSVP